MERKSQIGGGKETKNWVILCARSMTPGLIWSHAVCVLLHAIRQIRGLGLAMLMVPALLLTVSHTYTNNSCTVSINSQHLPIRSHYKTCSHYILTLLCQYVSYVTWSRCMARHSKSFVSGYVFNHRSRFRPVSVGEFEEYCQIWLRSSLQRNYKNYSQSFPHLFPGLYFL